MTTRTARLVVLALLMPYSAAAQGLDGTIAGAVKDASGGVLPGVTITIRNLDRGIVAATTHTAGDGSYAAVALPPGQYSVTAELSGFATQEIRPLTLRIADRLHVDLTLSIQSISWLSAKRRIRATLAGARLQGSRYDSQ
jgi:hypothetical protein